MKQIIINLEDPEIKTLEKLGDKDAITKVSFFAKCCFSTNAQWRNHIIIINSSSS